MMDSPDVSDDALASRAAAGSTDALEALVERYFVRARRYAWRVLGDAADAEDAVQDAFIRLQSGLSRYHPQGKFEAWFFRILVNACRAVAKRQARHAHESLDDEAAHVCATCGADAGGADLGSTTGLDRALESLEPLLREAFMLRYVEDLSYAQMSEVTGAAQSALRMRVKRARDALRVLLGNAGRVAI